MIHVAAAVIRNKDRIFICKRGEGGNCPYLWEFPGGKLEQNETSRDCLIRECREELGIEIGIEDLCAETTFKYPDREISFTFYNAKILDGEIRLNVHKDAKWVKPSELDSFDFCPADVEIVNKIKNMEINQMASGRRELKTGKKYRHFKGKDYLVLYQARHSETLEEMVVYQALYGERGIWVRPLEMFLGQKEVNGKLVNRFEEIEE